MFFYKWFAIFPFLSFLFTIPPSPSLSLSLFLPSLLSPFPLPPSPPTSHSHPSSFPTRRSSDLGLRSSLSFPFSLPSPRLPPSLSLSSFLPSFPLSPSPLPLPPPTLTRPLSLHDALPILVCDLPFPFLSLYHPPVSLPLSLSLPSFHPFPFPPPPFPSHLPLSPVLFPYTTLFRSWFAIFPFLSFLFTIPPSPSLSLSLFLPSILSPFPLPPSPP